MVGRRTKRKWSTEINVEVKIEMKLLQFDCLMSVAPQVVVFPLLWHLFAPNYCGYLLQKVTECMDSPIMHGYCPGRVIIPCPISDISPVLWLMFPLGAEVPCRFRFEKGENAFNQQTICILNPCINMVYGPYYFQWKKSLATHLQSSDCLNFLKNIRDKSSSLIYWKIVGWEIYTWT